MVQKWIMCIEVSCFLNPGRAIVRFVLYNSATKHVLNRKKEVQGRTTNNKAYYIALVEGLKEAKNIGVNDRLYLQIQN